MKRLAMILVAMLLWVSASFAQHYNVTRSDYGRIDITFTAADIQATTVKTPQGNFSQIVMDDYYPSVVVGKPQLPVMSQLLEIPVCDDVVATVKDAQYVEMDASELGINHPIYPAQPAYPKSYSGTREFVKDAQTYSQNAFYAEPLVRVEKAGTMRDITLANICVSPVAYNPVTGKVRIYRKVDVEVSFVNANLGATRDLKARYGSPLFTAASQAVINPMPDTREEFSGAPIRYLIVAHSMFRNNEQLIAFAAWKKRIGYKVDIVYTDDANVGTTTTSIKNYIMSQYTGATATNPAPTYLLFVGDHGQVPAFSSTEQNSHVTDLYYACWTTGDNIPDCYYGRFSAQNANQLAPQINKTLMYEQYTMPDPSYLGKAVLIAGTDASWAPTHADGQINYVYDNYINTSSSNHTYTTVYKHNYNCSSQAATIRSEIGAGCGWANYTAHGGETGWSDPSFSNSNVSAMANQDKYGLMIGNCCLTGKFNLECFGEALLRAENKGAMAYIGASEVSYWNEDVYWAVGVRSSITANMNYQANNLGAYDRLFHTHGEVHDKWFTSLGGFMTAGNLSVQASSSDIKKYYWEIYHIFGDPSIRPYLGIPSQMTVNSADVIPVGTATYSVNTEPYAYVALTYGGEVICAAFADASGSATLNLVDVTNPGSYELAVGAQNHIQFFKNVDVIVPSGPFVVANSVALAANNYPLNGTSVNWNLSLTNLGVETASGITATMTSLTPGYTVTQNTVTCSSLAVNGSQTIDNAFTVAIPHDAVDGEVAQFQITVNWPNGSSTKNVNFTVLAPYMQVTDKSVASTGAATAIYPGDQAVAHITLRNGGHADATNLLVDLTCNYSGVTVTSTSQTISWIGAQSEIVTSFNLQVGSNVPTVSIVPLYYHIIDGDRHVIDTFYLTVGRAMEDFETGDFSQFNWTNNNNPWYVTTENPYAGTHCARSKYGLSDGTGGWWGSGTPSQSALSITVTSLMDGELSYFRKVSSEANYDKFKLYIDNNEMDEASGTVAWTQKSYSVSAGTHTFKFAYEKDASQASGSDCAWIDNVILPGLGTKVTEDILDEVGIADHVAEAFSLNIYPNPTNGNLNIRCDNVLIAQVQVFDIFGKLLLTENVNDNSISLNLSGFASGVYVVRTTSADHSVVTRKVVKR